MRRPLVMTATVMVLVAGVTVVLAWARGPALGQDRPIWAEGEDGWTPPRTPWGTSDLSGIWSSKNSTPLQRPDEYADREYLTDDEVAALDAERERAESGEVATGRDVRAQPGTAADVEGAYNYVFSTDLGTRYSRTKRTSLIIDPPTGRLPPLTDAAEERRSERGARFERLRQERERAGVPYFVDTEYRYDNPEDTGILERCQGVTIPCTGGICGFSRIVQGPEWISMYYEQSSGGGGYRRISLDGRPHLGAHIRQWLGDSVGHWEGDTLVVDTTNFTNQTNYQGSAENLHLIERYMRVAPDLIQYQITVEDESVWTQPWTMELALVLQDNIKNQIGETGCHEGNYSLTSMLAGARLEEARGVR